MEAGEDVTDDQRSIILETLLLIDKSDSGYNKILNDVLDKYSYLDKQKRGFITRIVQGTIERRIEIDYIIDCYSKVKTNKLKPVIRTILRMSIYQLLYMDSVPQGAVCNEAVKLATKKGFGTLKGYVNGVLRTVARNKDSIPYPSEDDREQYLSIKYSTPLWLVSMIENTYKDYTEKILSSTLENDNLYIRTNLSKITTQKLREKLLDEGIETEEAPYLSYALKVKRLDAITKSECFAKGLFQVQDVSSMLCVHAAGIKSGDKVLDICAAPGGKTMHALDILDGTGEVIARDISEAKTQLIRDNINRCGFTGCTVEEGDALTEDNNLIEQFDVVICDLPCSGLGITGRKNDIKYKMSLDKMEELSKLQKDILSVAYKYVKKGGILMYSTCTINRAENIDNVEWIIENLPLRSVSLDDVFADGKTNDLLSDTTKEGYLQLLMGVNDCDGFFISKFIRE